MAHSPYVCKSSSVDERMLHRLKRKCRHESRFYINNVEVQINLILTIIRLSLPTGSFPHHQLKSECYKRKCRLERRF